MSNESILLFVVETVDARAVVDLQSRKRVQLPKWRPSGRQLIAIVVALMIIYIAYGFLSPSVTDISSSSTLSLSQNQTRFVTVYSGSPAAIKLSSTSPAGASFIITSVPVLYGPVVSFALAPDASLNVSTDGSKTADMNIRLVSSTAAGATVEITPFLSELGVKPSSGVTLLNPASLSNIGSSSNSTLTTVTTVSTQTTTVAAHNSSQILFQQALSLLNKTGPGILMKEYKTLYQKDVSCTPALYNSTYATYYSGSKPPAPVSFSNVSAHTPTDVTLNLTALTAKDNVLVTYSTVSPSADSTGPAIIAIINTSSASFLRNLTYTGLYTGLNYSILNSSYSFQSKILNACGALISPP